MSTIFSKFTICPNFCWVFVISPNGSSAKADSAGKRAAPPCQCPKGVLDSAQVGHYDQKRSVCYDEKMPRPCSDPRPVPGPGRPNYGRRQRNGKLPENLREAVEKAEASAFVKSLLPEHLRSCFIEAKKTDWKNISASGYPKVTARDTEFPLT